MIKFALAASLAVTLSAGSALAEDRAIAFPATVSAAAAEAVSIDIRTGDGPLWSGTLTLGPQYGNAYFSQSKNEFALPCKGKPVDYGGGANSNSSLSFNISRANWQQEPDKFNVTLNWTKALDPCEGQGNDTYGFTRMIEIERGHSVVIEGANGAVVTITRVG